MLSCAICADLLLASEPASSTRCGHIFHEKCVSRWMSSNHTCPQCRQISDRNSVHRVYLPDHQFERNDILEKLNEIAMQKKEQESVIKNLESQKRKLEYDLKVKKKQYHKVLQRQKYEKHGKGVSSIPRAKQHHTAGPSTSHSGSGGSSSAGAGSSSTARSATNEKAPSSSNTPRHKRNLNRILRSKEYFRQKRAAHRNGNINNNNNNNININNNNNNNNASARPHEPIE